MQFELKSDRYNRKNREHKATTLSSYLSLLILFFLATSCTPSTTEVAADYNINGDFLLEFTVTESSRADQAVGSTIESERSFSSNGNTVSAKGENSVSQGPRTGNTIMLSRTTDSGIQINTTLTLTSDNSFTGFTTALYPDSTKVTWSLIGTRQ